MARDDLMECVSTSSSVNPSMSLPIYFTDILMSFNTSLDVIVENLTLLQNVDIIGQSSLKSG